LFVGIWRFGFTEDEVAYCWKVAGQGGHWPWLTKSQGAISEGERFAVYYAGETAGNLQIQSQRLDGWLAVMPAQLLGPIPFWGRPYTVECSGPLAAGRSVTF
jgi:hypothetical protein